MRPSVRSLADRSPAVLLSAAPLLLVYLVTLAPSVTLWDSGEFLSAVQTLGVPHPPGTPLFVYLAHGWATLLPMVDFTVAVNAGSAVATALGVAVLARTFVPSHTAATVLAALVAGTTSAIWQSATETEVYGYALCLGALMLAGGSRAGRVWSGRDRLLLAFLMGLAVPLHISALVAGPAAIVLSATDAGGSFSLRAAMVPVVGWLTAVGIGTLSLPALGLAGAAAIAYAGLPAGGNAQSGRPGDGLRAIGLATLGASFVLVLLVRAGHDPGVNQGNPSDMTALLDLIGRRQYDVPPIWPRRAAAWLQVGNMVQYADWQFAFGLDNGPGASWFRTPVTLVFVALGALGAKAHRRALPREFGALVVLFVCASLGVVTILNLRAGPSYGWGILPAAALHEARERDYFFALAFGCWGLWAGMGVFALCTRVLQPRWIGVVSLLALVPLAANWGATNRRRAPDAVLARALGTATLAATPPGSVLVLGGDNDTYAVWWAQHVKRENTSVVPVTVPLLGARWYRAELARRYGLLDAGHVAQWRGTASTLAAIAMAAGGRRVIVAGAGLEKRHREAMGGRWVFRGMAYRQGDSVPDAADTLSLENQRRILGALGLSPRSRLGRDPTSRYVQRLLLCVPVAAGEGFRQSGDRDRLLESTCNY